VAEIDEGSWGRKKKREANYPLSVARTPLRIAVETSTAARDPDRIHILNTLLGEQDLNAPLPDDLPTKFSPINHALRGKFVAAGLRRVFTDGDLVLQKEFMAALVADGAVRDLTFDLEGCKRFNADSAARLAASIPATLANLKLSIKPNGCAFAKAWSSAAPRPKLTAIGEEGVGLNLKGNSFGDEGWSALIAGVCASAVSKISSIDVAREGLGRDAGVAIGQALRTSQNASLTHIDLAGNDVGREGASTIGDALCANRMSVSTLNLDGSDLPIKELKGTEPTEMLDLSFQKLGYASAIVIAKLVEANTGALTSLNLDGFALPIKQLYGRDAAVGEDGEKPWGQVELKDQTGTRVFPCAGKGTIVIGRNEECCDIPIQAEKVSRMHCTIHASEDGVILTDISSNGTYVDGVVLGKDKKRVIDVGARITFQHAEVVLVWKAYSGPVRALDFMESSLSLVSGVVIAKGLEVNRSLTDFSLARNKVNVKGATEIGEAIKLNRALVKLNLEDNMLCGVDVNGRGNYLSQGIMAVAAALHGNGAMTSLNLHFNNIGPQGAAAIAEALRLNGALTELDLMWNKIGPKGTAAIGDALRGNRALTSLNLASNEIDAVGAQHLSAALKVNEAVFFELNLSDNNLGNGGGKAMYEALQANAKLTNLDLRYSEIGDVMETAMQEFAEGKPALTLKI
jgi:Ran GTPase-activating protein (RanGAP) involved in mRNA processing and transport